MKQPVRFNFLLFDRSSKYPNGVYAIQTKPIHKPITYLEAFSEGGCFRNDIAMLNCYDADDKHTIINEHLGKWDGLNWYSNDSHKQSNSFVYFGNEKVSKGTKAVKTTYSSLQEDYFFMRM